MFGKSLVTQRRMVLAIDADGIKVIDPAVDVDASDLAAYAESLYDPAHVKIKAGAQATWWTLKPLTRRQKDAANAIDGYRAKAVHSLRCALQTVEGFAFVVDGSPSELPVISRDKDGLISESWMDAVDFPEAVLVGLWVAVKNLSEGSGPFSSASGKPAGLTEPSGQTAS